MVPNGGGGALPPSAGLVGQSSRGDELLTRRPQRSGEIQSHPVAGDDGRQAVPRRSSRPGSESGRERAAKGIQQLIGSRANPTLAQVAPPPTTSLPSLPSCIRYPNLHT